jgi:invasion protein IalB
MSDAFAQQRTMAVYGDWTLSCLIVASGSKSCGLVQSQKLANQSSVVSQIGIGRNAKTDSLRVSIEIRPDAWMPGGVSLIESFDSIAAPFKWCTSTRCLAEVDLSDENLKALRIQKDPGKLSYKAASQAEVSIPVSFNGFGEALDALQKQY